MRRAELKLNLEKCVFGVQSGKVLGCLVYVKGIKVNLDKINAIVHMKPPQSKKELQKLAEWNLSFFTVLRGSSSFYWGPKQQKAYDELKDYIH
jgi:hypothetical protein